VTEMPLNVDGKKSGSPRKGQSYGALRTARFAKGYE
jgi:hypothetical protein